MSILQLKLAAALAPAEPESFPVVVIGGGQAGLSVGYHLARRKIPFVILDAGERVGDSWRRRWDSLRLFTPAQFDGLDGMPFPAPAGSFPTKDLMADYLASYTRRFRLPVRNRMKVDSLSREGGRYRIAAGGARFEADHVVVAMANFQAPCVPAFGRDLDPRIVQLHAGDYRNPSQLGDGPTLVVGAGNSGAEISLELARTHKIWLSGRDVGEVPFRIDGFWGRHVQSRAVLRLGFHHLLTADTPMGRKQRAAHRPAPLIRAKTADLVAAGVERTPRTIGVRNGRPQLEDGRELEAANVVWCTGFRPDFSWIRLPVFAEPGAPSHRRGVVGTEPGLYFVGLHFLYAMSSTMVHGVGRDARYVADIVAARVADAVRGVRARAERREQSR